MDDTTGSLMIGRCAVCYSPMFNGGNAAIVANEDGKAYILCSQSCIAVWHTSNFVNG